MNKNNNNETGYSNPYENFIKIKKLKKRNESFMVKTATGNIGFGMGTKNKVEKSKRMLPFIGNNKK